MTSRTRRSSAVTMIVAGLLVSQIALGFAAAVPEPLVATGSVIINEVKSGNSGSGTTAPAEYVTLHNTTDSEIALDGWRLEFAKQTFPPASCEATDWKAASSANSNAISLGGTLTARGISTPFPLAINNDTSGAVQLVDSQATRQDLVGWSIGAMAAPCVESTPAPGLLSGKSLQRYLGCISNLPIDIDDNGADFTVSSTPVPGSAGTVVTPQCTPVDETPGEPEPAPEEEEAPPDTGTVPEAPEVPETPAPASTCAGLIIGEVLPNPSGTDTGHEYIELHNPTAEAIALDACRLQTSASTSKFYALGQGNLQPGEYRALSDGVTGLTLPNASGGTVWLLAADDTEVFEATYPGDLPDDVGWAYADGIWNKTYTITPNAPNLITPVEPCPAGQTRNTETNRCITVSASADGSAATGVTASAATAAAGLAPCKAGQERNPETNRCRNVTSSASAGSTATPCKAGQERNPETNRCRNAATASAKTAAACPAGQERNPDTNRCRKITASAASKNGGSVEDAATTAPAKNKPYGLIAATIFAAAIGYAIYEWRQEISARLQSLTSRFRRPTGLVRNRL